MTAVVDSFKPFSAELHVIKRLNTSLYQTGGRNGLEPGRANSPFSRFHPPVEHVALAPLRNDVPLLDPCCGQLSAGAEVDLGVTGRQKFIGFHHVPSALWVPPGFRERPQTTPNPSGVSVDLSKDKAWNSRRIPDAVLRARLNARHSGLPDKHTGPQDGVSSDLKPWTDDSLAVRHFRYTSSTQRSYEEVGWDMKLPRRLKAPETTLEKMADPVCERPSSRRYHSRPQLWQSIGSE
ncbi:uncharacterized protein AKAME5_000846300 [Lates japonicus]|uniref:Spermatogenesis-associated protein 48 n=1 Tax=Lates japonicus TaxID=270547 RepID=A0AAD3R5U3_LATJO|nr:uncharacterized protein AKAME5_000846300 [Lates japonicus]